MKKLFLLTAALLSLTLAAEVDLTRFKTASI